MFASQPFHLPPFPFTPLSHRDPVTTTIADVFLERHPVPARFFMVWNLAKKSPTVRHPSFETAQAEAHRLAKLNPAEEFFVLEATALVTGEVIVGGSRLS